MLVGDIQTMGSYSLSLSGKEGSYRLHNVQCTGSHTGSHCSHRLHERKSTSRVSGRSVLIFTPCVVWSGGSARKVNALTQHCIGFSSRCKKVQFGFAFCAMHMHSSR